MNRPLLSFVAATLFAATALTAGAEQLYDNGVPDRQNGSEMTRYIEADDFTVAQSVRLDRVKFWDFELPGSFAGHFVWEIYSNSASDSPGTLLASGTSANLSRFATGYAVFGGFQEYFNTFDVGGVYPQPGTYWLALHNGPLDNYFSENVFWAASANQGPRPSHGATAPLYRPWFSNDFPTLPSELAFSVEGVILPTLLSATSELTHGASGTFGINLPLTNSLGVESRRGAGTGAARDYTIVLHFDRPVNGGSATLAGTGSVGNVSFAGDDMIVSLVGVTDMQTVTLTGANITTPDGGNRPSVTVHIGFLIGDVNGNGAVNSGDALVTRSRSGQNTDANNCPADVNADGIVNAGDALIVRGRSGNALP